MTKEQIYEKLTAIFREVFDDEGLVLEDATGQDDIADWDSLMHINLVFAIEQEFSIKFSMDEVTAMKNFGMIAALIQEKIS